MPFEAFTFPLRIDRLGVKHRIGDVFDDLPAVAVAAGFQSDLLQRAAHANLCSTRKARADFVVSRVLWQVLQSSGESIGLYSGVELSADPTRGLDGVTDFLICRNKDAFPQPPIIAVVETTNAGTRDGFGPCIAAMYAARLVNVDAGMDRTVYGVATTGTAWHFMALTDNTVTLAPSELYISDAPRILGILDHIIRTA